MDSSTIVYVHVIEDLSMDSSTIVYVHVIEDLTWTLPPLFMYMSVRI